MSQAEGLVLENEKRIREKAAHVGMRIKIKGGDAVWRWCVFLLRVLRFSAAEVRHSSAGQCRGGGRTSPGTLQLRLRQLDKIIRDVLVLWGAEAWSPFPLNKCVESIPN